MGDSVKIPKAVFGAAAVSATVDLFAYIEWTQGGSTEDLINYEKALRKFWKTKNELDCQDVCDAATKFINGVPSIGTDVAAGFFLYSCTLSCCEL